MAKSASQQSRIDEMMEQASEALVARDYFACERLCAQALRRAHATNDMDRMARILLPLQEARRQKRDLALDSGRVVLVDDELPTGRKLAAGCYLVAPPRVGVDGRLLREAADEKGVPVVVVVREPATREGFWPIVAVGPVTVRAKVRPPETAPTMVGAGKGKGKGAPARTKEPAGPALPSREWFVQAGEALGDAAISQVPADAPAAVKAEHLYLRLEAVPDHEKLHQRLEEACRTALTEPAPKRRPNEAQLLDELDE